MFGKKQQAPIRTLIGEGTVIRGELQFTDGLRIDGQVIGDVVASGPGRNILVISEKARVEGTVAAGHVIVNGRSSAPSRPPNCSNCSPRRASRGTCAMSGSRCTRAPRSTANCGRSEVKARASRNPP